MNTQTQEALKMAIEVMEEGFGTLECEGMLPHRYQKAIQACKEALAEPKREWRGLSDDLLLSILCDVWHRNISADEAFEKILQELNT